MRRLEQWNRRKLSSRAHTGNEQRSTDNEQQGACGMGVGVDFLPGT